MTSELDRIKEELNRLQEEVKAHFLLSICLVFAVIPEVLGFDTHWARDFVVTFALAAIFWRNIYNKLQRQSRRKNWQVILKILETNNRILEGLSKEVEETRTLLLEKGLIKDR